MADGDIELAPEQGATWSPPAPGPLYLPKFLVCFMAWHLSPSVPPVYAIAKLSALVFHETADKIMGLGRN